LARYDETCYHMKPNYAHLTAASRPVGRCAACGVIVGTETYHSCTSDAVILDKEPFEDTNEN